jgi:hypothetical protein
MSKLLRDLIREVAISGYEVVASNNIYVDGVDGEPDGNADRVFQAIVDRLGGIDLNVQGIMMHGSNQVQVWGVRGDNGQAFNELLPAQDDGGAVLAALRAGIESTAVNSDFEITGGRHPMKFKRIHESDADSDGTPDWKEMEMISAKERRRWLETASDDEKRKWIHGASDEELKSVYHPEDTLTDAVGYAISPILNDTGGGPYFDAEVTKRVEAQVRETMVSAGGQERRMIKQIMRMNPKSSQLKPFHDMARQVIEALMNQEEQKGLAGSSYEDTLAAYKKNPEFFNENRESKREERQKKRLEKRLRSLLSVLDNLDNAEMEQQLRDSLHLVQGQRTDRDPIRRADSETDISSEEVD